MKSERQNIDKEFENQRSIETSQGSFRLWLEFEVWRPEEEYDPYDEFFNMSVELDDGRRCGLNVWTFGFLEQARTRDTSSGENLSGQYICEPDLLVEKAERSVMEDVVKDMLEYELSEITGLFVDSGSRRT